MGAILRAALARWGGGWELARSFVWASAFVGVFYGMSIPCFFTVGGANNDCRLLDLATPGFAVPVVEQLRWVSDGGWYLIVGMPLLLWAGIRLAFPRAGKHAGEFVWLAAVGGMIVYQIHALDIGNLAHGPATAAAHELFRRRLSEPEAAKVRLRINRMYADDWRWVAVDVTSAEQFDPKERREQAWTLLENPMPQEKGLAYWVIALAPEFRAIRKERQAFALLGAMAGEEHETWEEWQAWYEARKHEPEWAPMVLKKVMVETK